MSQKKKSPNSNAADPLCELVKACYQHVAPNDVDAHFKRIKRLSQPENLHSAPSVLNQGGSGIKFADLFCGAGGLSIGFELEGAECKYALDHDSSALETFAINRPKNIEIIHSDIRKKRLSSSLCH